MKSSSTGGPGFHSYCHKRQGGGDREEDGVGPASSGTYYDHANPERPIGRFDKRQMLDEFFQGQGPPPAASTPRRRREDDDDLDWVQSRLGTRRRKKVYARSGPYQCQDCSRSLGSQTSLDCHRESYHTKMECRLCPSLTFEGKAFLKRHMKKVHCGGPPSSVQGPAGTSGQEIFVCNQCGKELTKHSSLQSHLRSFHEPKPCPYCDEMVWLIC